MKQSYLDQKVQMMLAILIGILHCLSCSSQSDDEGDVQQSVMRYVAGRVCLTRHIPSGGCKVSSEVHTEPLNGVSGTATDLNVRMRVRNTDTIDIFVSCFNVKVFDRRISWLYAPMDRPLLQIANYTSSYSEMGDPTRYGDAQLSGVFLAAGDSVDIEYVLSRSVVQFLTHGESNRSIAISMPYYNGECRAVSAFLFKYQPPRDSYTVRLDVDSVGSVQEEWLPEPPSAILVWNNQPAVKHILENSAGMLKDTFSLSGF